MKMVMGSVRNPNSWQRQAQKSRRKFVGPAPRTSAKEGGAFIAACEFNNPAGRYNALFSSAPARRYHEIAHRFHVGEALTVVPNHVCICVNMHHEVFLLRNQQVVGCWRVAGRGKIR